MTASSRRKRPEAVSQQRPSDQARVAKSVGWAGGGTVSARSGH